MYFTDEELHCKCCKTNKTHPTFLPRLLELRQRFGKPMIPNSCCRCANHNKAVDGAARSYHLMELSDGRQGALAIDISTSKMSQQDREELIAIACTSGWSVGLYNTFLHLDRRVDLGHAQGYFDKRAV